MLCSHESFLHSTKDSLQEDVIVLKSPVQRVGRRPSWFLAVAILVFWQPVVTQEGGGGETSTNER